VSDDAGQYQSCGERRIAGFAGFADGPERPSIGCAGEAATIRYVSDELAQRDRVSAWREQISDLLMEIEVRPDAPASSFKSVVVARSLRDLRLLKMNFTASQIVRKVSHGEGSGYFLMHVNFSGVVVVSSMGRLLTLNEGEAVVLDGAQPFTIHRQETGSSYVVRIPRGRMAQLVFLAETVVMRRLPGAAGSAHLFTAYMDAVLLRTVPASPRVDQLTYRHISELLALLLDPGDPAMAEGTDSAGITPDESRGPPGMRFQAARSYVVEHAHDEISIRQVADHLGITERHVQRMFENHGTTFTTFLNEIRLARAHAMLCDRSSDKLRIRSICFKTGFRDVSHFNRVFRARYGCTPAEVRKTRDGGATPL
jgi:AraC-like DNA-binding protein